MSSRFTVTYDVRSSPSDIEARARAIAVEQSVEMPLEAIDDEARPVRYRRLPSRRR